MRIRPFAALRPPCALADKVASLPYDVVTSDEARALAAGNPMSFYRVIRSEIDLPAGTDPHSETVYRKAADNFRAFREQGYLVRDPAPSLFVYRQCLGKHSQDGIVALCHSQEYEAGIIKKHEKTRKVPEEDRTRHITAVNAQTGLVFLAYRDSASVDALVAGTTRGSPLYDFTAEDGVRHTVWKMPRPEDAVRLFDAVPVAYIADGHHRAAAAARVARERRAANPALTGEEEFNWFTTVLFPASQLRILAYNRAVRDLKGLSEVQFLAELRKKFVVSENAAPEPKARGNVSMYLGGRWHGLAWTVEKGTDPVAALDVSVLQERVLSPLLGIGDPRQDPRIEFVGGKKGTAELERLVKSGRDAVAFSMYPTSIDQLMSISDAGGTMPPKSTWFEPKLRSGLLVHPLD